MCGLALSESVRFMNWFINARGLAESTVGRRFCAKRLKRVGSRLRSPDKKWIPRTQTWLFQSSRDCIPHVACWNCLQRTDSRVVFSGVKEILDSLCFFTVTPNAFRFGFLENMSACFAALVSESGREKHVFEMSSSVLKRA